MQNNNCYKFKINNYKSGLLDNSVDATYIIHLENNGRINMVLKQLDKFTPTKLIYILYNKGYKNCKKKKFINNSVKDLIDANINIFNHAKINNYDNILILEDDFFFDDEFLNKTHINKINFFLNKYKNNSIIYTLGCLPIITLPYNFYHNYTFFAGMHSCIFTKSYRDKILLKNQETIFDWDYENISAFTYYKPLCYQIIHDTENKKNWGISEKKTIFSYITKYWIKFLNFYINNLELDKSHKNYYIAYINSKLIFCIILLLLILITKKFFNYQKKIL